MNMFSLKSLVRCFVIVVSLFIVVVPLVASDVIEYRSKLVSPENELLTGVYDMNFKIYAEEGANDAIWEENISEVEVNQGEYTVRLGEITSLENLASYNDLFIEVNATPKVTTVVDTEGQTAIVAEDRAIATDVQDAVVKPATTLISSEAITMPRCQILRNFYSLQAEKAVVADNALTLNGLTSDAFIKTSDLQKIKDSLITNQTGTMNSNQNIAVSLSGFPAELAEDADTSVGVASATAEDRDICWALNGSDIYNNNVGGVGIGCRKPNNKLQVSGLINFFDGGNYSEYNYSTAIGAGALAYNSDSFGTYNTALGNKALFSNQSGDYNTASGAFALYTNASGYNTASGAYALFGNNNGSQNTADGVCALRENTDGACNTANGASALYANSTGNYNTAVGMYAGDNNRTGSNNTFIGYNADVAFNNLVNAAAIGANATVGRSNAIILGSGVSVGIGTTNPSTKAILELSSTTQGLLFPRMTTTQRDAITSAPEGLMIYNTTTHRMNYRTNSGWREI